MANLDLTLADWQNLDRLKESILEQVWERGRNSLAPYDGEHYVLRGYQRPVSVSRIESIVLAYIAARVEPQLALEIGTGFGYSAGWMAIGIRDAGNHGKLYTVDDHSEGGLGVDGIQAAREIWEELGVSEFVKFFHGHSPEIIPVIVGDRTVDMAFVDADHHNSSPLNDYRAVAKNLSDDSVILFHDVDPTRYTVPTAVAEACADGWTISTMATSCSLTIATRASWSGLAEEALEAAIHIAEDPCKIS